MHDTAVQFAIVGTGDKAEENKLRQLAKQYPTSLGIKLAYCESSAHLAIGGADAFLMPSRFEPCGLTQMYSLRYGTIPIVRHVGGLADTVIDASSENIARKTANGFSFTGDNASELVDAIRRALKLYENKRGWKILQLSGMQHDFSWNSAAESYMKLYSAVIQRAARTGGHRLNQL